jgi:hypothetical protein
MQIRHGTFFGKAEGLKELFVLDCVADSASVADLGPSSSVARGQLFRLFPIAEGANVSDTMRIGVVFGVEG